VLAEYRWLKPMIVGQVEFFEWTGENHLRHTHFVALRDNKKAKEVVRD
jgi:bifunctional non-homologous end joining protein LigD